MVRNESRVRVLLQFVISKKSFLTLTSLYDLPSSILHTPLVSLPVLVFTHIVPLLAVQVVREVAAANGDEANGENGGEAGEESAEEPDSDEERKKAAAKKKKKAAAAAAEKVGGKGKAAAKSSAAPTTAPTPAAATAAAAPPTQQQTGSILDLNVLFSSMC